MDFRRVVTRFRQFGGIRLVWKYIGMGLFWPIVKAFFSCLLRGRSFKQIYPVILQNVEPFLEKRYYPVLAERKGAYCLKAHRLQERSKIIWFCWLQGMEQAPNLVHVCYESLKQNLPDREIKVIDAKNWKEFIELPDYVIYRWERKQIAPANFSDLLRLELLIKYGGTWIDSTVLCTGLQNSCDKFHEYLDADLFLFQYTPEGTTKGISISNWFITSCTNNEVLMVLRDMLYAYWKDYDCTIDYYIFHLFFELVAREYPVQVGAMPYGSSQGGIALGRHWREKFSQKRWDKLVSQVPFHKLSYRATKSLNDDKNNYYNWVLNLYPRDKYQA